MRRATRAGSIAVSRGITAIELPVVVVIIGLLISFTIPAVQYAREGYGESMPPNLRQVGIR